MAIAACESVRGSVGKSSSQMKWFFQEMIKKGELIAYTVEVNKRTVEETEEEQVIRIRKGATLTPTKELYPYENIDTIVEDPKTRTKYLLHIGSEGGMFSEDGDSQTIHHRCVLERLAQQFDPRKVVAGLGGIYAPKEVVSAILSVGYGEDWGSRGESDGIRGTRGNLAVEGEQDGLFEKVCEFVRGECSK